MKNAKRAGFGFGGTLFALYFFLAEMERRKKNRPWTAGEYPIFALE